VRWSLPPPASLPSFVSLIWTYSYTLYKPAIDSATCRTVCIVVVTKTAFFWRLPGHLQLYTTTNVHCSANVGLYVVRYRDMKCRDLSVCPLAYDMNTALILLVPFHHVTVNKQRQLHFTYSGLWLGVLVVSYSMIDGETLDRWMCSKTYDESSSTTPCTANKNNLSHFRTSVHSTALPFLSSLSMWPTAWQLFYILRRVHGTVYLICYTNCCLVLTLRKICNSTC